MSNSEKENLAVVKKWADAKGYDATMYEFMLILALNCYCSGAVNQ